jgi:hypothetical protein
MLTTPVIKVDCKVLAKCLVIKHDSIEITSAENDIVCIVFMPTA